MKTILVLLAMVLGLLVSGCATLAYQEEWTRRDNKEVSRSDFLKDHKQCEALAEMGGWWSGPYYQISALRYESCMNQKGYYKKWKVDKEK
jgi:hypothetical protein